jgi:hypothetical protein
MNSNFSRTLKKIITAINNLHDITRKILKIGVSFFIIVFFTGISLFVYNKANHYFNDDLYYTSISMIKASFTVIAEVLFGCLLIDYGLKKYEDDDD